MLLWYLNSYRTYMFSLFHQFRSHKALNKICAPVVRAYRICLVGVLLLFFLHKIYQPS